MESKDLSSEQMNNVEKAINEIAEQANESIENTTVEQEKELSVLIEDVQPTEPIEESIYDTMKPEQDTAEGVNKKAVKNTLTGIFSFQFDNDEPVEIAKVYNNQPVVLEIPSPTNNQDGFTINPNKETIVQFKKGDKVLKLMIKSVE